MDYGISEFLAVVFLSPFLIWFVLILFDGLGIFKDNFYTSNRRTR